MRGSCCGSEFGSKEKSHLFCGINARREKWLTSVERLDAWRDSPVSQPADTCIVCSLRHCEYVSLWIRVNLVEINRIEYNGTITTVKISNKKKKYKFLGKQKKKKSVSWQFFTLQIQMIDAWAKLEFYFTGAPGGCWRPQVTRLNNIIIFFISRSATLTVWYRISITRCVLHCMTKSVLTLQQFARGENCVSHSRWELLSISIAKTADFWWSVWHEIRLVHY